MFSHFCERTKHQNREFGYSILQNRSIENLKLFFYGIFCPKLEKKKSIIMFSFKYWPVRRMLLEYILNFTKCHQNHIYLVSGNKHGNIFQVSSNFRPYPGHSIGLVQFFILTNFLICNGYNFVHCSTHIYIEILQEKIVKNFLLFKT